MHPVKAAATVLRVQVALPQHFLNFLPEPQGHGSLRPTLLEAWPDWNGGPAVSGIETCLGRFARQSVARIAMLRGTVASSYPC
jgi:hypothetical protein